MRHGHRFPWRISGQTLLGPLAVGIGAVTGLFAVLFRWLIEQVQAFGFGHFAEGYASLALVMVPTVAGLLVGLIVYYFAREAKGHGVPEVMYAIVEKGGIIRPRVPFVKMVASALTIGTGGSAGREGPIVQIGAGLGSTAGQMFRMSDDRIKTLVGCGVAAGISATFNAPVAGVIFALEVILGDFVASTFSVLVLSSVAAAATSYAFWGNIPAFQVPQYRMVHPVELGLYALLGVIAGVVAVIYVRTLYATEDAFDRWRIPEPVKPAIGGLLFGAIAVILPESRGTGYGFMSQGLLGHLPLYIMAALVLAKILTTSLTLGSGGSGGVFAPGLFIGVMTGGAFGALVHSLWPGLTAETGAYALVGMGAVFAGATQAPITAVLMLFEMTRDYRIILPMMVAVAVSWMVASLWGRETIYTLKLARRGVDWRGGRNVQILRRLRVAAAMTADVHAVDADATLEDVIDLMQKTRHNGFPVVEKGGRLVGVITLHDVRNVPLEGRLLTPVRRAMTQNPITVTPQDTLEEALHRISVRDVGRLPVVDPAEPRLLVGVLTRSDILQAYDRAVVDQNPGTADPSSTHT